MKRRVALIILDGMGIGNDDHANPVYLASMPFYKSLLEKYPHSKLKASGVDVGLPEQQFGNSEVGHLHLGVGQTVYQGLTLINLSIQNKSFFQNKVLIDSMSKTHKNGSRLHLIGLLSNGGVHSHFNHLIALLEMAVQQNIDKVFIHIFLDGRDTDTKAGIRDLSILQQKCQELKVGTIASITGRYYGMDRDCNWDRTQKAYNAINSGIGHLTVDYIDTINQYYSQNITDEFLPPIIVQDSQGKATSSLKIDDSVILFNFRPDRARQITQAIGFSDFDKFERTEYKPVLLTTFMEYHKEFLFPVAFEKQKIADTLGAILEKNEMKQLRAAETEKYAHVTFFFNAMREIPYNLEDRILIPSPKVATYDLKPEMSAYELTDEVIKQVEKKDYDFLLLNFANPDMLGHTGNLEAAVECLEVIDKCLKKLVIFLEKHYFDMMITSDHGNIEKMINEEKEKITTHTNNLVRCIYIKSIKNNELIQLSNGSLIDITVTILSILNINPTNSMTGKNLIIRGKV